MPEKDSDKKDRQEKATAERSTPVGEERVIDPGPLPTKRRWIIWSIVGASGVLLLAISAALFIHGHRERAMDRYSTPDIRINSGYHGWGGGYRSATFYTQSSETDGPTTTTTTVQRTYTQGVVKSVSGDNIVVVGNGKEETIKTDSDTVYTTDTKPEANDSVVIIGTADGDTITADRVTVANY